MRYWTDKDASGSKLTDGRICLVIKSDTDPDMPEIRTYGHDKEEVLDKVAKTAETAQSTIHRMRNQPPATPAPAPAPRPATPNGDAVVAAAVADLSNPAKAPAAIKTLLRAGGVDVDQPVRERMLRNVANVCERWESEHPDYPKDPRNDRILMNKAAILAGGAHLVKSEHLDAAFTEAQRYEMLFEPKPAQAGDGSTVQPSGSSDSRTVRNATSYRRNTLRSSDTPTTSSRDTAKEAKWRDILENGTGKALEDAMRYEPGFTEWANKQHSKSA
jgi:hypothetical protein